LAAVSPAPRTTSTRLSSNSLVRIPASTTGRGPIWSVSLPASFPGSKHDAIAVAALVLFARDGYERTSVDAIAAEAARRDTMQQPQLRWDVSAETLRDSIV
jgi:hypothetical protein